MTADSPQHAVEIVDDAFNRGDVEAVLNFYETAAVVVAIPTHLSALANQTLPIHHIQLLQAGYPTYTSKPAPNLTKSVTV